VEPVAGNMGLVLPQEGFLAGLRHLADRYGALLIADEVMTGFRVHPGGAQALYNFTADLTCLGKVIGGGLPVGAYAGRADIMRLVAPAGSVYQAGTLSGNPLAMAAGIATLRYLQSADVWERLRRTAQALSDGLRAAAHRAGMALQTAAVGSMWGLFFTDRPVIDYESARGADTHLYAQFFHAMLDRGVYLAPSQFEAAFVSTEHGEAQVEQTLGAAEQVFRAIARQA
jgi:glutamate-1-semialdehyde 2,1-aminomutase